MYGATRSLRLTFTVAVSPCILSPKGGEAVHRQGGWATMDTGMRARSISTAGRLAVAGLLMVGGASRLAGGPDLDDAYREGFEGSRVSWVEESTDVPVRLIAHDRVRGGAKEGEASERLRFEAGAGSRFFVGLPLPKIEVTRET